MCVKRCGSPQELCQVLQQPDDKVVKNYIKVGEGLVLTLYS